MCNDQQNIIFTLTKSKCCYKSYKGGPDTLFVFVRFVFCVLCSLSLYFSILPWGDRPGAFHKKIEWRQHELTGGLSGAAPYEDRPPTYIAAFAAAGRTKPKRY